MAQYTSPEHHPAFEEYCETIYELHEDGLKVIQARIAERLEVTRPAVSFMIKRMDEEGLVEVSRSGISLTKKGLSLAHVVVRRHRLAERLLTDFLGLSWAQAHHEAGKWEHVISPAVEAAMVEALGFPTTCPHGNPIPGSDYSVPKTKALSELGIGNRFVVDRIPEELEFSPGLLEFLEGADLVPGTPGSVVARAPDGTTTVQVGGGTVGVGRFAADRILVSDP